ncbi:MAG: tRNA pseudouridine(55) synthase TruB [Ruminococcaceae bacterium]|nr:tRNA pseudouridine(55) synthase TruB [Oscillospiraceae bacterium]
MTGIIPLKKSENMTSFLAVKRVRGIVGEKKCGHTGTLDPMATGVLPVALGGATRFIELLPTHKKAYKATFKLGLKTDTLDIWGTVIEESKRTASLEQIAEFLPQFKGKIMQIPPMYSALKKDGVRLYELARQGIEVEREERECEIFKLEVEKISGDEFSLFVECSAGTYIRSLIGDIGDCLNTGATMTSLNRTYACGISEEECISLEELESYRDNNELNKIIVPVDKMLKSYPEINVSKAQGVRFKNGGELLRSRIKGETPEGLIRVYLENKFLGLGEVLPESENLTVKRVYVER